MTSLLQNLLRFLLPFLPLFVSAQAKQYSFKHFSTLNGLASNMVTAVVQDRDGYMWIATANGLQRYDGNSFLTFRHSAGDAQSLPSDLMGQLYLDRSGRLWVVSDNNRLGTFDTRTFKFHPYSWSDLDSSAIRLLFEMPDGTLMMFLESGRFYSYREKSKQFQPDPGRLPVPPKWTCNSVSYDPRIRKYWLSCDSGLVQVDPISRRSNYRGHNSANDPIIRMTETILKPLGATTDGKGNLIFLTWPSMSGEPHFYWCDPKKDKPDEFLFGSQLGYHEPKGALLQRNGRFWIHGYAFFADWTGGGPTLRLIPNEYRNEQSLKFDYAYNSFEDRESNIWIGTDNGVYLFNPDEQIFNSYYLARPGNKTPMEKVVQAIEETRDGKILVGCWGAGLFAFNQSLEPVPLPRGLQKSGPAYSVWDLSTNYKNGDIWIAQQGGRLSVYNQDRDEVIDMMPEIFGGSTIRQVDEDTSGNMWFGTQNGRVVKWDLRKSGGDPRKGYELITMTGMVHKVHYDYQGYVYIATYGKGLLKIDARTGQVVHEYTTWSPEGQRLFTNFPGDMSYYNDTTLIVTAGCINVINTRTNEVRYFSSEDGLPSNNCQSVQKDNKGILWIGMLNGICRLNLEKKVLSFYDRRDGIVMDKFSMAGIKQLKDKRLVFYTDHNFLVFDPRKFGQENLPPEPHITGFKLAGNNLSLDSILGQDRAVLRYNNTSIGIHFSALSYLPQRKLHYYYMLENLDKDWIHTDQPIEAVYNYLPPGNYVFKVKSENADGMTSREIATLPIVVRAPFWQTWWFFSLAALLVIAILYLLDRERMNKLRSLQQVRRQIRLHLRNEVSNTLNNISVLSEIAKIRADKNVEQSKDFIDQISHKSRYMMEAMDDMLWSIDPQNDSMQKTLLRIKEVTDGLRSTHDMHIDLIVDHKVEWMALGMKLRHELFFFYKEAMSAIVENVACGQVFVNFNKVRAKLLIEILCECDEATEAFAGRFRQLMTKRVSNLPATLDIIADNNSFAAVLYVTVR